MTTINGFDMTSAPTRRKPITHAACRLQDGVLELESLTPLVSVEAFRACVAAAGKGAAGEALWVAGLDMPFGQSVEFLRAAGWPEAWEAYVRHAGTLSREAFADVVYGVMAGRPKGRRLLRRITDVAAGAVSPMSLAYVPVGRMFHVLAPVIEASGVDILPLRMTGDRRVLLEAYPALVARAVIGKLPYKDGPRAQWPQRAEHRSRLLEALPGHVRKVAGLALRIPEALLERMQDDRKGDFLDALLCAVQAAQAVGQPEWGLPPAGRDDARPGIMRRSEGWIAGTPLPD